MSHELAVHQNGAANPLALLSQAMQAGATVEVLEKLTDLAERHQANAAKMAYTRALNAAQSEMPAVYKDAQNSFNKTRYATLENVQNTVRPVYLKHGFSVTFGQDPTCQTPGLIRLYVDISHKDGHTERHYGEFPMDDGGMKGGSNKAAIQAVGSAFSYGRRYLLGLVFNLVFTNEDNDGVPVSAPVKPAEPAPRLLWPQEVYELKQVVRQRAEAKGIPGQQAMERFLQWAGKRQGGPDAEPLPSVEDVTDRTLADYMKQVGAKP